MAALTKNRNTPERSADLRQFEAAATIFAGSLVALNASGKAVPASDAAGLQVVGIAQGRASSGGIVTVKNGCFRLGNGPEGKALALADIGSPCYVLDDQTVGASSTASIPAGILYDIEPKGVWVLVGTVPTTKAES